MKRPIGQRKQDHLRIAGSGEAAFRSKTTLLEEIDFIHCALPEIALSDVELETTLFGKRLRAPLVISGMTGGTPEAGTINRVLAEVAEMLGIGFGLGSQRPMLQDPTVADTFAVRSVAPSTLILANVGLMQAKTMPSSALLDLVQRVDADALCLHLNPAMELIQSDGDRDFGGGLEALGRICAALPVPVVVKETGCGISRTVARQCQQAGAQGIDVSGAGGTSWVGVETKRAEGTLEEGIGMAMWDWGIPTAASIAYAVPTGLPVIATGGIRTGLDVARALSLGARTAGVAAPVLKAYQTGGQTGVLAYLQELMDTMRAVVLLTGQRRASDLACAYKILGDRLRRWTEHPG